VRYLQCILCVPRMCRDPARPRAAQSLLPDSAASPRARIVCGVSAVRGPISDPHGPYVRAQSIRLKLRCDRKVRNICAFLSSAGEPLLMMGFRFCRFCDRFPVRRARSAGAWRSSQMVVLDVRVVNSGVANIIHWQALLAREGRITGA
jgi:hypothetical protein